MTSKLFLCLPSFHRLLRCRSANRHQDFFYVCPSHLKDTGFCTPVVDQAALEAKKKRELDEEVARVKKEYEEKQQKKKEKEKKEAEKSDETAKEKDSKKGDDEKPGDKAATEVRSFTLTRPVP
jgi:hypothetical protein